jgi:endonuclease-3
MATAKAPRRAKPRRRRKPDPVRAWTRRLGRTRPGLIDFTLGGLDQMYGRPAWRRVHEPTSELVLTILAQNSADVNAEHAFELLRARWPSAGSPDTAGKVTRPGWGGRGIGEAPPPDWGAIEHADPEELVNVIRPGGLAPQKAPRIQASLRRIRERQGDYSLEFLGEMAPLEALAWLTAIPGIGRKTASVVLLFSFGMPLMPVDRHVERVSKRIGLIPAKAPVLQAHEMFLGLLDPERVYEAHVNLITHGRRTCTALRPACGRCALRDRCRYVDPRAP